VRAVASVVFMGRSVSLMPVLGRVAVVVGWVVMGRVPGVDARTAVGRADAIRTTVRRIEAIRTIVGRVDAARTTPGMAGVEVTR